MEYTPKGMEEMLQRNIIAAGRPVVSFVRYECHICGNSCMHLFEA